MTERAEEGTDTNVIDEDVRIRTYLCEHNVPVQDVLAKRHPRRVH